MSKLNQFGAPARRVFFLVDRSGKVVENSPSPKRWRKVASRGCCLACKLEDRDVGSFLRYRRAWFEKTGTQPVLIDPTPGDEFVDRLREKFKIDPSVVDFSLRELGLQCMDELIVARPRKVPKTVEGRNRRISDDYELEVVRFGCPGCMPQAADPGSAQPGAGDLNEVLRQIFGGGAAPQPSVPMVRITIEMPANALLSMIISMLLRNAMPPRGGGSPRRTPDDFPGNFPGDFM